VSNALIVVFLCTKSSGHGILNFLSHALYVNWMVTACPVIIMEVEILAVLQALEVFLARGGSEILRVGRGYELPGVLQVVQLDPHQECLRGG